MSGSVVQCSVEWCSVVWCIAGQPVGPCFIMWVRGLFKKDMTFIYLNAFIYPLHGLTTHWLPLEVSEWVSEKERERGSKWVGLLLSSLLTAHQRQQNGRLIYEATCTAYSHHEYSAHFALTPSSAQQTWQPFMCLFDRARHALKWRQHPLFHKVSLWSG